MFHKIVFTMFSIAMAVRQHKTDKNILKSHHNVTLLLDGLLDGYDKNLRPNFGGPPIVVEIDFNVRSMGPISEVDMTFSMDCYFRQTWIDRRLSFTGDIEKMTLGISTLEKIWKPDTYFFNGKQSYLHTITVPNRFVRIEQDGRVLYSQRLTVKASCPMNLENFPIDTQRCPLSLGSFGYSVNDVLYRWNALRRVVIASDMKMSQFDLISNPSKNDTTVVRDGEYSTLSVNFYLQRHTGYFLIQVYAPCMLLVVLSWVAFWINREATADRVALGVMTILTMTFLGLDSRNDLPKVSYSTALDSFMAISFTFVFATIIQFALVHYFTKRGSGEVYLIPNDSSEDEFEGLNDIEDDQNKTLKNCVDAPLDVASSSEDIDVVCMTNEHDDRVIGSAALERHLHFTKGDFPPRRCPQCSKRRRRLSFCQRGKSEVNHQNSTKGGDTWPLCLTKWIGSVATFLRTLQVLRPHCPSPNGHRADEEGTGCQNDHRSVYRVSREKRRGAKQATVDLEEFNSVSKIDSISRILFPATFLVINLFYWHIYLSQNALYSGELP